MKISGINFPKPLLDALRDGDLVIFAGAGVSMGEPARLPNFRRLAEAIAQGTGEVLHDEPEDQFLGRLQHKGQNVHERAAQALSRDGLEPTDLHRFLLQLYSGPESTRIVTTNFDLLFEQAAEDVFESLPEVFTAPALPLGGKFKGIVHVHGSVDRTDDMILTDMDFGRAYLTEGWARRFLVDLFRSFPILFVGYSHNDIVVNYLARAMPPSEKEHFALTDDVDVAQWQILGVEAVIYPKSSDDDHSDLYKGVDSLARYARRGILDWHREITEVSKSPPSLNEEAMDLIDDALWDPTYTRFFTEAASHPEWVHWLDQHKHLDGLFGVSDPEELGERDRQLALWLAKTFARDHAAELFLLIGRHRMRIHPGFWTVIGRGIGLQKDWREDADTLAKWVSLLLATSPILPPDFVLPWLSGRSAEAELTNSLLDIFDAMSTSRLLLRSYVANPDGDANSAIFEKVEMPYDHHLLSPVWNDHLKPKLNEIAEPLLAIVVRNLETRHRALHVWELADRNQDITNISRSSIERHEQNRRPKDIDVAIDVARDCLEYLAATQPEAAATWCERLMRADVPILRRLAVHILSTRKDLTADEKINWLLIGKRLFDFAAHREILEALRGSYPHVSSEQRKAVIAKVFESADLQQLGDDSEYRAAYRQFIWLDWLCSSDPNCELAEQAREDLHEQHPDFRSSEQPKHIESITEAKRIEPHSPRSVDDLLSRPAIELLDDLLTFNEDSLFVPNREGLLRAVEEAAKRRFDWGLDLADVLAESGRWDTDLWPFLTRAWSRELDKGKHREVLARLSNAALCKNHAPSIADTLYALVKDGGTPYAADLLPEANQVANTLWACLDRNEQPIETGDWLFRAINHPAGVLTQYWLGSLALWRNQQDVRPDYLGAEYFPAFSNIIQDKTYVGRLGKAVLASNLRFILAADEKWAIRHLVPLFDHVDDDDYRAVWDGFLYDGINPQVASLLENAFFNTVSRIRVLFPNGGQAREQFVSFYALMVAYFVDEPLDPWLPKFFENAEVEDICQFAWCIGAHLRGMDDAKQQESWERWLKRYWENRLQGIPAPLDIPSEVEEILDWLPYFSGLFPEAVELAIRLPQTTLERGSVIDELSKGELWSKYPEATAKLLIHLGGFESPPWAWHGGKQLIKELLERDLATDIKTKLKELSARLGL